MASSQIDFRFILFRRVWVLCLLLLTFGVLSGSAQTPSTRAEKSKLTPHTDISLGVFGQFTPTRAPVAGSNSTLGNAITQTTQGTSVSSGVLGTFHQSLKPWLGYNVNLGYNPPQRKLLGRLSLLREWNLSIRRVPISVLRPGINRNQHV